MNIKQKKLDAVHPYEGNPRKNERAVKAVAESLRQFGPRQPIVIDRDGVIVVGHTRYYAALEIGMTAFPVHVAADLTPEQVKVYRIADNRTADLAEWDIEKLNAELASLGDSMRSSVAVNIRAKRNIEFLDEHGFSGLYRMGRWFYQKFHTAQDVKKLMDAHGVMVVKNDRHHVSWQVAGVVGRRHSDDAVEAALAREFNMPLNDSGRRLGRHETAVAAYRAAREKHGNQG